jgi:hypothetical protein
MPRVAGLSYGFCLLALGLVAVSAIAEVVDRFRALGESTQVLARLEERATLGSTEPGWPGDKAPPGSPFLEGPQLRSPMRHCWSGSQAPWYVRAETLSHSKCAILHRGGDTAMVILSNPVGR